MVADTSRRPVQIFVGSMLGASEYVAEDLQRLLVENNQPAEVYLQPDITNIDPDGTWILCSSTHGAGDLPDNIQSFAKALQQQRLDKVKFLVVALGDSSYDTFCEGGKTLFTLMQNCGATPLAELFCIDVLTHSIPEEIAVSWLENLIGANLFATC